MPTAIDIDQFLHLSEEFPVMDVRTPAEFRRGHIPRAYNVPLFDDEERAIVGTIYKQKGRQPAIIKGLEVVGPKMSNIVVEAERIVNEGNEKKSTTILVHCWRGGMRSGSVSWLLEMYGYKVYTLKGGYKFFRRSVLASFNQPRNYLILGGRTGSGKTLILQQLAVLGEQTVDLEKLAHHKGSSFGSFGEEVAPSQEQFENKLALTLKKLNPNKTTWVEDEGRMIGKSVIPGGMWEHMRNAKIVYLDIPFEQRTNYLKSEYGKFSKEQLCSAIERITRRLGGMQTKQALEALAQDDLKTACEICLAYYDKSYDHGLNKRESNTVTKFKFETLDVELIAERLRNVPFDSAQGT